MIRYLMTPPFSTHLLSFQSLRVPTSPRWSRRCATPHSRPLPKHVNNNKPLLSPDSRSAVTANTRPPSLRPQSDRSRTRERSSSAWTTPHYSADAARRALAVAGCAVRLQLVAYSNQHLFRRIGKAFDL